MLAVFRSQDDVIQQHLQVAELTLSNSPTTRFLGGPSQGKNWIDMNGIFSEGQKPSKTNPMGHWSLLIWTLSNGSYKYQMKHLFGLVSLVAPKHTSKVTDLLKTLEVFVGSMWLIELVKSKLYEPCQLCPKTIDSCRLEFTNLSQDTFKLEC